MTERWVLNASPIIVLCRIGQENLLLELADQIVVPRPVAKEITAGPTDDYARKAMETGQFNTVDSPPPPPELLSWDLGAGETAVISFVLANPGWTAILDDGVARKCAHSFSIPLKGTLGIVLLAKSQGIIPSAAEVLKSLRSNGFRLEDGVMREALHQTVNEDWPE